MSRDLELTTTSYVVLGLVAVSPGYSSYDMKREVQLSIGKFSNFPHTSLYTEPARLVEAGLLTAQEEESGRRRRSFFLTDLGHEVLADWLSEPSGEMVEVRYPAILKLYFSGLLPEAVSGLATAQIEALSESLMALKTMHQKFSKRPKVASQVRTLELGIALNEAALAFWRSVMDDALPNSEVTRRRGKDRGRAARKSE